MESKEDSDASTTGFASKNDVLIQKIITLLSILSKQDALRIFILARDGIKSQLYTPSKIGLTKKQYYTRLHHLVKLGLLTKHENVYRHTMFGRTIYHNYLIKLGNEIKNSKYMEMVDVIQQSSKFSKDEIDMMYSKIKS